MSESNSSKILSARMALAVSRRVVRKGINSFQETKAGYKAYDQERCLAVGRQILGQMIEASVDQMIFAVPHVTEGKAYGRVQREKSGCPVLQAKLGFDGIFYVGRIDRHEATGEGIGRLTRYEDSLRSNADVLRKQELMLSPVTPPSWLETIYIQPRHPREITQARSLVPLGQLLDIEQSIGASMITTDPMMRLRALHHFSGRVAQYYPVAETEQTPASLAGLIPHQPSRLPHTIA